MADTKSPALSLSTTDFDRPEVDIDGERYAMRAPEELTTATLRRLLSIGKELEKAGEMEDPDESVDGLERGITDGVGLCMVDLPGDVLSRLTIGHQMAIIRTFTELAGNDKSASATS